jgi:hypothetical protein
VRRNLLWANSLEQGLHVVEVREDHGILFAVIGVNIALAHILKVLLIVALTILSLVNGLGVFLGLRLEVLESGLECSLKLGLYIEGNREGAACRSQ